MPVVGGEVRGGEGDTAGKEHNCADQDRGAQPTGGRLADALGERLDAAEQP